MHSIEGWTDKFAEALRRLIDRAVWSTERNADLVGPAARRTGGLPVYADIGGCLLITPDGAVLEYAFEGESVTRVTDRSSIRLACAAAAEKHPELAELMPRDGSRCRVCDGTGRAGPMQLRCGVCDGTGRVADG